MKKVSVCTASSALLLFGMVHGCDAQVDPGYQGDPLTSLKGRVSALVGAPAEADVGVLWLSDEDGQCSGPVQSCSYVATGAGPVSVNADCIAACGTMPDCVEASAIEAWATCQRACGAEFEVSVQIESHACFTGAVGQTAPVMGDFPAQFSLDVLSPPPEQALLRSDTGERVALGLIVALEPGGGPFTIDGDVEDPPPWLLGGSETHFLAYAADPIASDSTWGTYLGGAYSVGYHLIRVVFGNRCGLPRLYNLSEDVDNPGQPDTGGGVAAMPTPDVPNEEPAADPADVGSSEPDYGGVPLVCGNGICETNEDCSVCSDCIACDGSSPGTSSGRTNVQGEYFCQATSATFAAADGSESEIELLIAPARLIDWPAL
jgi:hypothetical protein